MREILFRGKTYDGTWEHGDLRHGGYVHNDSETYIMRADVALHNIPVDPKTVGQYTGLTDKNGKRIFEGDIIRQIETGETFIVQWFPEHLAFMAWNKSENTVGYMDECWKLITEIIGNIHDNTDLMGGTENE